MGGHGYIREHGMEQLVRDARITQLYEGTNGIQALDLVGRKLPSHTGRLLRQFFHPVANFIEQHQDDNNLKEFILPLYKAFSRLQKASAWVAMNGLKDAEQAGAVANNYLRLFGLVCFAYVWARMVVAANKSLSNNSGNPQFYKNKISTAQFFYQQILPQFKWLIRYYYVRQEIYDVF